MNSLKYKLERAYKQYVAKRGAAMERDCEWGRAALQRRSARGGPGWLYIAIYIYIYIYIYIHTYTHTYIHVLVYLRVVCIYIYIYVANKDNHDNTIVSF